MPPEGAHKVKNFYRSIGWNEVDGVTEDAARWEDLRPSSRDYVSKCRRRVLRHIEGNGRILDMASGPIQYPEYLEFSQNFQKRYCVDFSEQALEAARARIGDHGVFMAGDFLEMEFEDNYFDCAISLHTIYHMEKQEEAVRKLLRITSGPVIVIYSNPETLTTRAKRALGKAPVASSDLYFHAHPIAWWSRFEDRANVDILPWRSFEGGEMKKIIPGGPIGRAMLKLLFSLEDRFPNFFVRNFRYPMIILRKHGD